ncbi:MAG: hypothetical protein M3O31_09540 [Acidobacteriota bacterium]|nr:hypothetical protein [Acidobacteriota bacterium]
MSGFTLETSPATSAVMSLASPFTVTGTAMGLALDMQVSQSQTYTTCDATEIQPFKITPTFKVAPVDFLVTR